MSTAEKTNNRIQGITELLTYMEQDAAVSKNCLGLGVMTKTAKYLNEFFENPSQAMLTTYETMGASLTTLVGQIVRHYFKYNQPLINKVFTKENSPLLFYIVLNEDNFTTRGKFFRFLEHYESLEFAHNFPVYFQFLPQSAIDKVDPKNELLLN